MKINPNLPAFGPPNLASNLAPNRAVPPSVPSGGEYAGGSAATSRWPGGPVGQGLQGQAVRRIQIRGRAGIWEVIQDDRFFGHYMGYQAAFDAAEAAALAIVANGGAADIRFKEARAQQAVPGAARGSGPATIGAMRTMEFRAGLAPVVR
jgi:hypothetical protein